MCRLVINIFKGPAFMDLIYLFMLMVMVIMAIFKVRRNLPTS